FTMNRWFVAGAVATCLFGAGLGGPAAGQQGKAPYAGGGAQAAVKDPEVVKLEAQAVKLEKQLKARPKDAKLKLQVADAYYKAGHALEYTKAGILPRERYRGALKYYRLSHSYNPGHKEAAAEKKQIEDIYKSMGRPIPQ